MRALLHFWATSDSQDLGQDLSGQPNKEQMNAYWRNIPRDTEDGAKIHYDEEAEFYKVSPIPPGTCVYLNSYIAIELLQGILVY
jgi:hypothetical protein